MERTIKVIFNVNIKRNNIIRIKARLQISNHHVYTLCQKQIVMVLKSLLRFSVKLIADKLKYDLK